MNQNKKPIIGIIARPHNDENVNVLEVVEAYRNAIILSGGNPILILPSQLVEYSSFNPKEIQNMTSDEKEMIVNQLELCDGILMPGGNKRYEYDRFITNYCLDYDLPVLGICLGMQLLATHINRDALEFTDKEFTHSHPGINADHKVIINTDSKLFDIVGEKEFFVNSRHKYKVKDIGTFSISAYSSDGVIEAIERKDKKFAIGVQWHPENLMDTIPSQRLFNNFIESCKKRYEN